MDSEVLSSQENQLVEFLAGGMPSSEVANLVGVSVDFIKNKLEDDTFRKLVKVRGAELRSERVESKYARTEESILTKIESYAKDEFAEIPALVRALEVIAKNRVLYRNPAGLGAPANGGVQLNVVTLMLPERAQNLNNVTLNQQGEIIAIGERNMASMPLDGVKEIFGKLETQQKEKERNGSNSQHTPTAASA